MDRFLPNLSPVKKFIIVPRMAPPWNELTTPPATLSLGLLKYLMNLGWAIVDVMIPESYPKRKPKELADCSSTLDE